MKSTNQLTFILIVAFLSLCLKSIAQQEHVITLFVNTNEIVKPKINPYCNFGQTDGSSNEDYLITVNVGDTIIWRGESTSATDDIVNIVSINHRGGPNIFDKNVLNGNGADPEEVFGTVLYDTAEGRGNKKDYKYTVKFTVYNNGNKRNGTFQIDPKIRVLK